MTESTALVKRNEMDNATLTAVVTDGDCSRLNETQRRDYYLARCDAAGLDPRTAPFMFTRLNGKLILYALKSATDQLASNNKVATTILSRETIDGVYCVTVRATAADGRSTEDMGAVQIGSLKGEALANALMKAVTKAKRRAVLSLCGLGMLDETEVQDVQARPPPVRGVIKDDDAPPAKEPAHDPVTGEIPEDGEINEDPDHGVTGDLRDPAQRLNDELLATTLVAACGKGFRAEEHRKRWLAKHKAEIEELKARAPDLYEKVKAAYEAATIAAEAPQEEVAAP